MWVRNGVQIKGQAMTYTQCHFCSSMSDADLYILQVRLYRHIHLCPRHTYLCLKIKVSVSKTHVLVSQDKGIWSKTHIFMSKHTCVQDTRVCVQTVGTHTHALHFLCPKRRKTQTRGLAPKAHGTSLPHRHAQHKGGGGLWSVRGWHISGGGGGISLGV